MSAIPILPRPPVDVRSLTGRSVELRRVDPDADVGDLWRAVGHDPDLWSGTPTGPFADEPAFAAWLRQRVEAPGQVLFAIIDKTLGRPATAGILFLLSIVPEMGTAEIGLIYGARLQRRVGGTESVFLALRHMFETLDYRRVEWRCSTANAASLSAARRFGFTQEGVLRQFRWIKGANYDTAIHAILDCEWPAIARRMSAWLAPENFADDGRQRTALSASAGD